MNTIMSEEIKSIDQYIQIRLLSQKLKVFFHIKPVRCASHPMCLLTGRLRFQ